MEYDYIIVGAGAAGCVLAYRLTEDPSTKVLLLEFGGPDANPLHYIPKGFFFTLRGDRYLYRYPTRPFKVDGTGETWTRGKVSGGSTTVNGMMYTRGFAADYDYLVGQGNAEWGWDRILPIFRKMEDHQLGSSPMRGSGGRYGVSTPKSDEPVSLAILESARNVGWKVVDDANEEEVERMMVIRHDQTEQRHRRWSGNVHTANGKQFVAVAAGLHAANWSAPAKRTVSSYMLP